jgi:hypothetical protein
MMYKIDLTNCNRVEVIDKNGRAYTNYNCQCEISMQDDNKTLKIFIKEPSFKSALEYVEYLDNKIGENWSDSTAELSKVMENYAKMYYENKK